MSLQFSFVLLCLQRSCDAEKEKDTHGLEQSQRGFAKFANEVNKYALDFENFC